MWSEYLECFNLDFQLHISSAQIFFAPRPIVPLKLKLDELFQDNVA